jgi:O-antigen/teichoic acid export membrane protein
MVPAEIIHTLFGPEYEPGKWAFLILVMPQLVIALVGDVGTILIMTGFQITWLILTGSAFLVCLILNLILIPLFGVEGAAIATAVGYLWLVIGGLLKVRFSLSLWPYDRRYLKGGVAATASLVVSLILKQILHPGTLSLILLSFSAVGMFILVLYLLGLDQEDVTMLRLIWKRVNSAFHG